MDNMRTGTEILNPCIIAFISLKPTDLLIKPFLLGPLMHQINLIMYAAKFNFIKLIYEKELMKIKIPTCEEKITEIKL